jgi:hypothetical protein
MSRKIKRVSFELKNGIKKREEEIILSPVGFTVGKKQGMV